MREGPPVWAGAKHLELRVPHLPGHVGPIGPHHCTDPNPEQSDVIYLKFFFDHKISQR